MKALKLFSTLLLLCFFTSLVSAQQLNHVQGEILVQLKDRTTPERFLNARQQFRGKTTDLAVRKRLSKPMNIYAFTFNWQEVNERQLLADIRQDPNVEEAQFNHFIKFRSTIPNDTQFGQQWQYINTGQSGGTAGADIDMDLAWDTTTGGMTAQGDEIVVCVIDDGIDITHPDIAPNMWYNTAEIPNNGIDDDSNGFIDDYRGWDTGSDDDSVNDGGGHGTPVAGIVGAKGNNNVGVAGVNWDVKLMIVQGGTGVESEVLEAYSYPLEARKKYNDTNGQEGAFVVATNASWGVDGGQPSNAPLWCNFYDTLGAEGILNAGATINGNQNVDTFGDLPTACPSDYLIAVTNMNHNDVKVTQAGYGSTHIDIGAFGQGTWTVASGGGYGGFGGTSGATPHVAGTIALLYSAPCNNFITLAKSNPAAAALQIKDHILMGGDDNASLQGITVTGKRLNVNNSMQLLMNNCGPAHCINGVQDGDETGVDCGGSCIACPTCSDGIQNGTETGIDCGGSCAQCDLCVNGIQDNGETGVDCGGSCPNACPICQTYTLTFVMDSYPEDISWNVIDPSNTVVASGGSYNNANATETETFCLNEGFCYNLTINDSYGDGLCCTQGNGSYTVTDTNNTSIASGGQFTSVATAQICVPVTSTPCPNILTVTDNPIPTGDYHAATSVHSSEIVATGATILFGAGTQICLDPGFEVPTNTTFEARIEACPQ